MHHPLSKLSLLALFSFIALLCGCESLTLENGKYESSLSGRLDEATVYNDLICLRLREPSDDPSQNNYWIWIGKFSIEDDGHIVLDMDHSLSKQWNFSYDLYRRPGSITVFDLGSENNNSFSLRLRSSGQPPVNRAASGAPSGSLPVYK